MSGRKHVSQDVWASGWSLDFIIAPLSSIIYSSTHLHSSGFSCSLVINLRPLRKVENSVLTIFTSCSSSVCSKKQKGIGLMAKKPGGDAFPTAVRG